MLTVAALQTTSRDDCNSTADGDDAMAETPDKQSKKVELYFYSLYLKCYCSCTYISVYVTVDIASKSCV